VISQKSVHFRSGRLAHHSRTHHHGPGEKRNGQRIPEKRAREHRKLRQRCHQDGKRRRINIRPAALVPHSYRSVPSSTARPASWYTVKIGSVCLAAPFSVAESVRAGSIQRAPAQANHENDHRQGRPPIEPTTEIDCSIDAGSCQPVNDHARRHHRAAKVEVKLPGITAYLSESLRSIVGQPLRLPD